MPYVYNHRRAIRSLWSSVGVVLCILVAIACVLQPGGRKLRYTGPCGKELCLCQVPLFEAKAAAANSKLTADSDSAPCHPHFAPAQSAWGFVDSGSDAPHAVYLGSTLFLAPAHCEPIVIECGLAEINKDYEFYFTEAHGRKNYPPPKFSA